ncbi:MAG: phosphodiester glycosidase family protein [Bacteroidota bacterium]
MQNKNMQKTFRLILLFIQLILVGCGSSNQLRRKTVLNENSGFPVRVMTDSLFNSKQTICTFSLHKESLNKSYTIEIAYNEVDLIKTSQLADNNGAIAAINGSFFNMDEGGSVTYIEINDSVISKTRDHELKWGVADTVINGAIILTKENKLKIESANTDNFYKESRRETFVLISGPLLISNSKLQKLPDYHFTNKRHPRTCLGITKDSIIFVTIDGRSKQAEGMNLYEAQKYMHDLGCIDAINLDGGGSTTIWTKNKGVVNNPSSIKGERKVANALLILKSNTHNNN